MATSPPSLVHDVGLIAGFDLRESIRTRRALVLTLLYTLIAAGVAYAYVEIVGAAEAAIAQQVANIADPGERAAAAAAARMMESQAYEGTLHYVAGDPATTAYLASFPPIVLIFALVSLGLLPWLIALTSYDLIAGDLHLRTVRFVALRTSRGAFVLGKLLSQTLLVTAIAAIGMIPVFALGWVYLAGFEPLATVRSLLSVWPILVCYAFAVLGPITCASQLTRTPGAARALAIGLLFGLWLLSTWSSLTPGLGALGYLTPFNYHSWFFDPDLKDRMIGVIGCLGLCAAYTGLGFLRFRRRDL